MNKNKCNNFKDFTKLHSLGPNLWISHDWEYRYASVGHTYLKNKGRGVDQETSQYLVGPPFVSCSATQLLRIDLIRLLIVACRMLSHSSSMAVQSCWLLAGTGTCCCIHRSRVSKTMGDMSGEFAGHGRTWTFTASRNCIQIFATWGRALSR